MTRNNDTSYRQQGRAVALAAIMVLSVVGASVAFTGAATAVDPANVDDDNMPGVVYPGQEFDVTVDDDGTNQRDFNSSNTDGEAYLVELTRDNGTIDGFSLVSTLVNQSDPGGAPLYNVDTTDTESGTEYAISNTSVFRGSKTNTVGEFVTGNEGFDATFDADSVDNADDRSFITLDNDRPISKYNVSVQVDGLEYDQLEDLFNVSANGTEGDYNGSVTNVNHLPLNGSYGPEYSDGDTELQDLKDENVLTLDLSNLSEDDRLQGDELGIYPENLADGEGFPDDGSYEFEFTVTDTDSSASDNITLQERDVDANFDAGSSTTPAGDIATFNLSMTDTDEAFVQIGGPDSGFVDILYIEQDDDAPVEVDVNTRLLGTASTLDAVYDRENTADFGSVVHGGADPNAEADSPDELYGNDGNDYDEGDYFDDLVGTTDPNDQITRPLQATDYQIVAATDVGVDEAVFDADADGAANNQLDSKTLTLGQPSIEGVTVHKVPEGAADDTTEVSELVDAATEADEVAIDDRLVVQVEATGIYGSMIANMTNEVDTDDGEVDWDRYADGVVRSQVLYNLTNDVADEGVDFSVEAETATGNQDANTIDLQSSSDSEAYVVIDEENGQFFLVADTSDGDAFSGNAPEETTSFTASLDYVADNSDDRYEFQNDGGVPFAEATDSSENNFPYLLQGSENSLSASADFDMAPRDIAFDNLNEDSELQVQATDNATVTATTNVAPGSDAEIRFRSTSSEESFQFGNDVTIQEDGSISETFDLGDTTVGDQFNANFRVGGSQVDSASGVVVEALGDSGDDEQTNETDTDDGETDDGSADDGMTDDGETDDGETDDGSADDGGDDGSTDDGTPGFGAVVALVALVGAALLAVRRQN